jgi:hypothetical protein
MMNIPLQRKGDGVASQKRVARRCRGVVPMLCNGNVLVCDQCVRRCNNNTGMHGDRELVKSNVCVCVCVCVHMCTTAPFCLEIDDDDDDQDTRVKKAGACS